MIYWYVHSKKKWKLQKAMSKTKGTSSDCYMGGGLPPLGNLEHNKWKQSKSILLSFKQISHILKKHSYNWVLNLPTCCLAPGWDTWLCSHPEEDLWLAGCFLFFECVWRLCQIGHFEQHYRACAFCLIWELIQGFGLESQNKECLTSGQLHTQQFSGILLH